MRKLGLSLGLKGYRPQGTLLAQAISAIRRDNGSTWYVPDDFGLVLGPELIVDSGFDSSASWTTVQPTSGSVTVSGGVLRINAVDGTYAIATPFPGVAIVVGKTYRMEFEITAVTGSGIRVDLGGVNGSAKTTVGVHTAVVTATTTLSPGLVRVGVTDTTVTRFSVREVLSASIYTDSTGVTPVSTVGDVLGLLTDRSYGAGNLGAEIVGNTTFDTASLWTLLPGTQTATISGGVARVASADGSSTSMYSQNTCTIGKTYFVSLDVLSLSGSAAVYASGPGSWAITKTGRVSFYIVADGVNFGVKRTGVCDITFDNFSVKEVLGNHATQPTTASKPVIARIPRKLGVNLVSNGDFSSGTTGWSAIGVGGSIAVVSGELEITGSGGGYPGARRAVAVEVGKNYWVSGAVRRGTTTSNTALTTVFGSQTLTTASGNFGYSVAPTATSMSVDVSLSNAAATGTAYFDNIAVQEVLEWTNAAKFDGSNDYWALSPGAILQQGSDHWVSAAFVLDVVGAQQTIYEASSTSSATPVVCRLGVDGSGKVTSFWRDDSGATAGAGASAPTLVAGQPVVITVSKVGSTYTMFANGVSVGSLTTTLGATSVNTANIGASVRNGVPQFYLNGKPEVALAQATLTEATRRTIERNLANRWGVTYAG